jgi:hypothetical protein
LAGLAVIFFGTGDGRGISNAILALAVVAAVIVWNLTKPGGKPVS